MKKIVSSLLIGAAALTLAACGGGGTSNSGSDDAGSSDKITVWAWDETFNIKAVNEAKKSMKTLMWMLKWLLCPKMTSYKN